MEDKIQEALGGLKDFQAKTVDYVFDQLYKIGRTKMLIADEVGLGKTIVAKGIIAKAFQQFLATKDKRNTTFNVVYICSNLALARQNINKLNFLHDHKYTEETISRLTYLAYQPQKNPPQFLIHSLTPGTSFDEKSHQGKADERAILFCLLADYSPFQTDSRWNGLKWILKGGTKAIEKWNNKIDAFWTNRYNWIRKDLFGKFRQDLFDFKVSSENMPRLSKHLSYPKDISLWQALLRVCEQVDGRNHHLFNFLGEIIRTLRRILSKKCLEYLGADIFILDEFQRYSNLIKLDENAKSPAIELARTVFSIPNAKILMLSATPFKPFTNDFDELNGEVHYSEFKSVLKFLMADNSEEFWKQYEIDRKSFFGFLRHPDRLITNMPEALTLKKKLETLYRTSIVRTEKLLASEHKDALIKQVLDKPIQIQPEDISDFILLDKITQLINKDYKASLPVPIEYVKSCPYPFTFLDNYQHKEKIRQLVLSDDKLRKLLLKTSGGWLNLDNINEYKPLIPSKGKVTPNAKLRLLLDETVLNDGWKYLWIPPSIPYYNLQGAYKNGIGYSKTLIFSSWKMVPRMVASLVSYEAERLSIGNKNSISEKELIEDKRFYFQKRRSPRPQFTFKVEKEDNGPQQMNNFLLTYPCLFLANFYDPAINIVEKKDLSDLRKDLFAKLKVEFKKTNPNSYVTGKGDWKKWYWLAPILLDKTSVHAEFVSEWLNKGMPPSELSINSENTNTDYEEGTGRSTHFLHAKLVFESYSPIEAGFLSDEQIEKICEHLVDLTLGSPAICYLRSQRRQNDLEQGLMDGAFNVASAFITLFNKPESIAVVRLHTEESDYWRRVLNYSIDGNIQAMLDEFVYLLMNGENIKLTNELSNFISDILSVRTASNEVEDLKIFFENLRSEKKNRKAIRSHYAVDFGNQKMTTASGAGRQVNIRQAFNSPFRPFVLASTSIGQEGLDFHLYCKKIFHWNLPSNPIDFEQREGRIHRYQGLVIRLNLADKYKDDLTYNDITLNIWKELFAVAAKEKYQARFVCDLIPFWHTETKSDIKIERFVPLYPFSKDIEKYNNLIKILTFYRLTFGQPRQEELVDALSGYGFDDEVIKKLDELIINLSPINF